jgi:hypothetical protein
MNRVRPLRNQTEVLSIYGQIEGVVARMMAAEYKLYVIEPKDCPAEHAIDKMGRPVQFAIAMPAKHLVEFHERCAMLRA